MKKVFWILVLGALVSGSMALALGRNATDEVIDKSR